MRKLFIIFLLTSFFFNIKAQDFSNKGKDFWLGYGSHVSMYSGTNGGTQRMVLYIATELASVVKVEIPNLGYSQTYNIPANTVFTTNTIPQTGAQDARLTAEGISNKGIHVTSDKNVVAYAHIYNGSISGASLLFPTTVLGKEYYSINYTQTSNEANSYPYFFVVATDTGTTTIEVIPTANTQNMNAGTTYIYNLTQGQVFNALGKLTGNNGVDLTGSKIKSISTGNIGCKKIAVFSGSGKINITCAGGNNSADNYIQQAFPKEAWGKRFLTVPTSQMPNNFYRICVSNPGAIVKRNGLILSGLINNFYYQVGQASDLGLIESDQPITVAQYITTANQCGNTAIGGNGDPEVIYLSPVEQNISKVILNSTPNAAISSHYINAVIKTSAKGTFTIDGVNWGSSFFSHPQDPTYSYIQKSVTAGAHTIKADSGFNAIAYGYGSAESYGYNAGTNVKDFTQNATASNPDFLGDTSITKPIFCKNSTFFLFQRLPYKPLSITWDFTGSGLPSPPFSNYVQSNPTAIIFDSTFTNGKWIYRFKNPTPYSVAAIGLYPFTVIVNNPTSDGCTGNQELDYELEIADPPSVNFTWTHTGCATDTVYFNENTFIPVDGRAIFRWRWLYHDNSIDSIKSPKKLYTAGGSFPVKLQVISDIGCLSDTITKTISLTSAPTCTITSSAASCAGTPITFTPSCSIVGIGTLTKWIWIWDDGSPNDTLLTGSPINHTFTSTGNHVIKLISQSESGCAGPPAIYNLLVGTTMVVDFTMPVNVCMPNPNVTFTNISNGGNFSGLNFTWNFGDGSPTTNTIDGVHTYTAPGPYTITLTAINGTGCPGIGTKIFSSINPRATSTFTYNAEVCIKDSLQLTSNANGNGATVTNYFWDFGDGTTSTLQNPKKKWATSGNKIIKHWIVTNQGCYSDTTTNTVYVNASPIGGFNFSNLGRCANYPITFNNTSSAADGNIINWDWDFGDASPIVNATNGNPQIHSFAVAGTYIVKLYVKTDKGCEADTFSLPITITATPIASFILPGGICLPSGFAQFTNNTTITDGTLPTVTYVWSFGDATPNNTTTNPSHIYAGTGPYTVKLVATSAIGCVDDSIQVLSNIYAQPSANFTSNPEVCINDNITFTSTSNPINGTIVDNYWDNGSGSFVLGTNTLTISFASIGNKTIRHYIITSNGCKSDTMSKTIFVNALPTANFITSALKCERDAITFTNTSIANNGNIVEWTWDFADGTPIQIVTNGNPIVHTFATANTFNVSLKVKTDKGCTSTIVIIPVTVKPKPVANFDLPINVCLPVGASLFTNTTTISDGTLPLTTYVWNFGDATPTTTTLNGVHNYSAVGPFNVKLQATSSNGCIHDTTKIFNNIRPRPTASFTNAPEVCVNSSITFTSTSTGNGGSIIENYWDNGSGTFVLGTTILSNTFATNGIKTIRHFIKTDQGCISDTMTKTIYVNALPLPNFTFSTPQCVDKNVTFTNTSITVDGVINSWNWDFGDGTNANTAGPHTHTYSSANTFNVSIIVTTDKGCTNIATVKPVVINPNPEIKMYLPEICLNDPTAQFLDSSFIADGTESQFTYLWNFGDANSTVLNPNTSTLKNPTHKFIQAANYNMWLQITSSKGCITRKDTVFTVNGSIPVANFLVQNSTSLCSNKEITIQNTSSVDFGGLTKVEIYWDWANNPLLKTTDQNPTPGKLYNYDYPDFGTPPTKTYTIRFVAYSGGICVNAVIKTVAILGSPTVTFTPIPDICQENPAATLNQAQELTGIPGVGLFSGNGIVGNLFNPLTAGIGPHLIRYTFTATNGCTDFKEQTVFVNPTPDANAGVDRTVLEGGNTTLLGSSTTNNVTYLWTPNTWLSSTSIPQPICTALDDITYTLKVTSDKNCTATDIVFVKVLKGPRVPNAFSPNGDGINDKWEIEFLDTYAGCTVEVFNIYGQKVYTNVGYAKPWDGSFNGKQLPIGTYYYIIEPKNGRKAITGYVGIVR